MKNSTSHSTFFAQTTANFGIRKRMSSLRSQRKRTDNCEADEDRAVCLKLQQALQKDRNDRTELIAEPSLVLPEFDQPAPENKLWKYFENRMLMSANKVEQEQANACDREFIQIRDLIALKLQAHRQSVNRLRGSIVDRNSLIHDCFEQMRKDNQATKMANIINSKKKRWIPIDNSQKINEIRRKVQQNRKQLANFEHQCQTEEIDQQKLLKQWIALLKSLLINGVFMKQGIKEILRQLFKVNLKPSRSDFPSFIDDITFKCFMKIYEQIRQQQKKKIDKQQKQRSFTQNRVVSSSIQSIRQIAKQPKLNLIYQGTKQYMADLLKNNSWKQSCILPKLKESTVQLNVDWRAEERRRIAIVYQDPIIFRRIKNMLFGPKAELLI